MANGLIVIHGIGEQERGDTLRAFTNGLYGYMHFKGERTGVDFAHRDLSLTTSSDSSGRPTQTRIRYSPAETPGEQIVLEEVHWQEQFKAVQLTQVIVWLFQIAKSRFTADRRWFYLMDGFIIMPLVMILGAALLALLFVVPLALQYIPVSRPAVNAIIARIQQWAIGFLVRSVGDVAVYSKDFTYASTIRRPLEDLIHDMANDQNIEHIHIIGHSLGAVIGFEVLSRTYETRGWGELPSKVSSFFSVGSPLEKVEWFIGKRHLWRLGDRIPERVRFFNIYTRFDPIADKLTKPRYQGVRNLPPVTNKEFPPYAVFQDHTSYWENYEVMEYILRSVSVSEAFQPSLGRPNGLALRRSLTTL